MGGEGLAGVGRHRLQQGPLLPPAGHPELDRAAAQPGQPGPQTVGALGLDGQEHLAGDLIGPVAVQLLGERGGQGGGVEGLDLVDHEPASAHHPAAADEEHLHRRLQVVLGEGGDVEVLGAGGDHLLALHGLADAGQLVAEPRRQLEVELLGGLAHLGLQPLQGRAGAAVHEGHEVLDDLAVLLGRDVAHARPRALVDVIEDAGPPQAPVPVEHALGAGPHGEGAQEEVQGLADGVGVGVGPEVPGALALAPALDPRPGDLVGQGHGQPGVGLVVAVADVVAGPVLLDQVVLELEGLDLALDQHPLQRRRGLDHGRGPRVQVAHRLEVAGRPLAQGDRLADVDDPPVAVTEQVHAGMVGDRLRLRSWAGRHGHTAILGVRCHRAWRKTPTLKTGGSPVPRAAPGP